MYGMRRCRQTFVGTRGEGCDKVTRWNAVELITGSEHDRRDFSTHLQLFNVSYELIDDVLKEDKTIRKFD